LTLDTSSFPAYLRSLNLTTPVVTRAGRIVGGPPAIFLDLALWLGLGRFVFDTPRNRTILANLGIPPAMAALAAGRLRSRSAWREVWEALAAPYLAAGEEAIAPGDGEQTGRETRLALALLGMAYGGDGYYFHTPMRERRRALPLTEKLYHRLRAATGERVEHIVFSHAHGATAGLLHFPPGSAPQSRWPALLAMHAIAGDKHSFDNTLRLFRAAGYATFCIDLPRHGESFDGPGLQPDDELIGTAALDVLAVHPRIDPERLGVMGGSLGAFWALRTASASPRARACLAYCSPFDIGQGLPEAVFGIRDHFVWTLAAPSFRAAYELAKPLHLREAVQKIRCPIRLVHGTQDHICSFTASYEIARRAPAPISVHPLVGVDHEAAQPSTPALAGPGIEWLRQVL
jgi:pimeloyl-ACP methyl ester carboxylesterase